MDNTEKKLCMGCMEERINHNGVCPYCGFDPDAKQDDNYIMPGTDLDSRYIIGNLQRYNGEGAVYLGYDRQQNQPVWIKEYFPHTIATRNKKTFEVSPNVGYGAQYKALLSDFIELSTEIRRLAVTEPVLPIENLIGEKNTIYVVYKYIESLTLEEYLVAMGGKLSQEDATELLIPLINCVDNFHLKGIIHRGLSPYTILVDENKNIYVDGFSLGATRTGGSELKSELFSGYSAPEQYLSTGWQGTWTDVYALAAVLYRTISGIVPPKSTRINDNNRILPLKRINAQVKPQLSDAIENATETSTQLRTQTVAAFLSEILAEDGVPKTEIFDIGRIPMSIPSDDNKYIDDFKPLKTEINSKIDNFKADFAQATISQPVSQLFEYETQNQEKQSVAAPNDDDFDDYYEYEPPADKGSSKAKQWIFLVAIALAVLIGVIVFAISLSKKLGLGDDKRTSASRTPVSETSQPEAEESSEVSTEPEVNLAPNLVGKKLSTVEFNTEYTDLYTFTIKKEYNDKFGEGLVAEQSPKAGSEMPKNGGTIVLTVSKGILEMTMPDLTGLELEEALQILAKSAEDLEINFEDLKIKQIEKYQLEATPGQIINTNPLASAKVDPIKDEIELYIALEPPSSQSQVTSKPPQTSSSSSTSPPSRGSGGLDSDPHMPG